MNKTIMPSIDVIIPVYNAPLLTKRCIDSVITYLGQTIRTVYIQDDASNSETHEMLDNLPYKQVQVYHAPKNQGFGKSVNEATTRSNADLVLVLNSDIEVYENFLPLLCKAFVADPKLAAISPVADNNVMLDYECYTRQPGNYIATHRLKGYAFLIRRAIFAAMGGFDLAFGRGYFEDIDLGNRLVQKDWHVGVHPDAYICHKGGGSFGRGQRYRLLRKRNCMLYLSRYPDALCDVLLVSGKYTMIDLPVKLADKIKHVLRQGGYIHLVTPLPWSQLPCMQMRNNPASIIMIIKFMMRGLSREDKRISKVWILPGVPRLLRVLLAIFIRVRKLEVQRWEVKTSKSDS